MNHRERFETYERETGRTATDYKARHAARVAFERVCIPGKVIEARWTNGGSAYSCRAAITKVNAASIKAELLEAAEGYSRGYIVTLPKRGAARYSDNNGYFPVAQ